MWVERWLSQHFKLEEINGHGVCPTYLYRWVLLHRDAFSVYIHKFVADDWSRELHDHPKHFWTIGLWGMYREEYWPGRPWSDHAVCVRDFHAPWFRHFAPEHRHRLMVEKPCWTLVIVGRSARQWGFWHHFRYPEPSIEFVHWKDYVADKDLRERVKSC